jgi:transcription initiation factor IIE alpha subunit
MAAKRHPKQPGPVSFTMDELLMINNALNEVCNGVDFDDDELATRLGYPREQLRQLLAKVSDLIEKSS